MFVKPNPDRTVWIHKGHEIVDGQVVGGEPVEIPLEVLHPHTRQPIPSEGMDVPEDIYWMRRLRDKDVVVVEKAPSTATPADQPLPAPVAQGDQHSADHHETEHGA